ncbi:MAG: gamma-glutamyltransferase [Betaproteobacteria bacterium RBG_16_58_11]|nr:MAG: gamma-glutamyltransferase [Betaproteobacteria bacterium RBG_16_58_11]
MHHLTRILTFFIFCFAPLTWAEQFPANAAIASAHPLATQAGREVLDQGGNAFDAAIAVAGVLAVIEPYNSGLGGGGFFLLHRARDGRQVMLDAREKAPLAARSDMYLDQKGEPIPQASLVGPSAAAIPGLPAGLAHLAKRYGRLPLRQSLSAAIRLAEMGFPIDVRYRAMAESQLALLQSHPAAAEQFLIDRDVPKLGALLKQSQLAATLRMLAQQGRVGFYRGPVARAMVAAVRSQGGIWTQADLARYQVKERAPIVFDYRGLRIVSAAPPSAGGLTLAETLNILARYDLAQLSQAQQMHLVAEALRRAYHDRARYLGDADFVRIPTATLLSRAYAEQRAASIDLNNATPSASLQAAPKAKQGDHTTHFSIVDRAGNRVAATLSINTLFGSGFVVGKTGVLLNNEMDDFAASEQAQNIYGLAGSRANRIAPGKRPLSSMSPTFVEDKRGVLILGTPGGSRIISMVLLAILGLEATPAPDVAALVSAPRFHHQYMPDRIEVEPGVFSAEVLDELTLKGHVVHITQGKWGNMQAVWVDRASGRAFAASDPRVVGGALAW